MTSQSQTKSTGEMGGKRPTKPGEFDSDDDSAKLPSPAGKENLILSKKDKEKISSAWVQHMVDGLKQNQQMFNRTLAGFMRPYYITMAMYVALFVIGIGLFITAVIVGLRADDPSSSAVAIVFGGLSVGSFLLFFIRQPLQALEENLEFISWLGIIYNTYWVRLLYMNDVGTIQEDLQDACDDYSTTVERLIDKHAVLRGKRPGGELTEHEDKPDPAPEDEVTEDESVEGDNGEGGAVEEETPEDESVEDGASETETPENEAADVEPTEGETADDKAEADKSAEGE